MRRGPRQAEGCTCTLTACWQTCQQSFSQGPKQIQRGKPSKRQDKERNICVCFPEPQLFRMVLCWSVCAGSHIWRVYLPSTSLKCVLCYHQPGIKHHKNITNTDISCLIFSSFFVALKHLVTGPRRGAYTCASYVTVSLDEMEKMSGSVSGSVLHQCAIPMECEGELNLPNLMFYKTAETEEKGRERTLENMTVRSKVSLTIGGQSSQSPDIF